MLVSFLVSFLERGRRTVRTNVVEQGTASGRLLVVDLLGAADRNATGLHGLGKLADELYSQQTAVKRRRFHLYIIGKVELTLERFGRNAVIEVIMFLLVVLVSLNRQHIRLGRDGDLVRSESSERQRDLVTIFAKTFDVVGWIVFLDGPLGLVEQIEDAIKPDGRPPQGSEVVCPHSQVLLRARWVRRSAGHRSGVHCPPDPSWRPAPQLCGKKRIRRKGDDFKSDAADFLRSLRGWRSSLSAPPTRRVSRRRCSSGRPPSASIFRQCKMI